MDKIEATPSVILAQLERILASQDFGATDRLREFLRFVVEETLAGRADHLKGFTIATTVYGRNDNFDSTKDPVVRTQAAHLRRALERYYLTSGASDPIQIVIPKGRYVPVFSTRGAAVSRPFSSSLSTAESIPSPDIAVLPLANLAGGAEYNSLVNGLALEFSAEFARYPDLKVIPCHGATLAEGELQKMVDLGRESGASFVLGGGLRVDAENAKLDVQLLDTQEGRQLWSGTFRIALDPTGLIQAQEEIAEQVVAAIGSEYGSIARNISRESRRKAPSQLSTYEAMLRFYDFLIDVDPERMDDCLISIQNAVETEPEYGPAWSALAALHDLAHLFDRGPLEETHGDVLALAQRGAILDPKSPLAHLALAAAHLTRGELDAFDRQVERVLGLESRSPLQMGALGHLLVRVNDLEHGLPLLKDAIELNPYHPRWFHHGLFFEHYMRGEFDDAYEEGRIAGGQVFFWSPLLGAAALGRAGRLDEARHFADQLGALVPDFQSKGLMLMRRMLKSDGMIEELLIGLRLAGL